MSEKKYTERDLVLAKREGFAAGFLDARPVLCRDMDQASGRAKDVYRLPKIERTRTVKDPCMAHVVWRADGYGMIWWARTASDDEWSNAVTWPITADRVALWAALLASPTELVEDDGNA